MVSEHINTLLTNQPKLNRFRRRCVLVWDRLGRLRRHIKLGTQLPEPMQLDTSPQTNTPATQAIPEAKGQKRKSRSDGKCTSTSSTPKHADRQSTGHLPKVRRQDMESIVVCNCSNNSKMANHTVSHGVASSSAPGSGTGHLPKVRRQKTRSINDDNYSNNSEPINYTEPHGVASRSAPGANNFSSEQATTIDSRNFRAENERVFVEPWNFGGPTETCEF